MQLNDSVEKYLVTRRGICGILLSSLQDRMYSKILFYEEKTGTKIQEKKEI